MRTFTIAATLLAVVALVSAAPVQNLEDRAALNIFSSTSSSTTICSTWKTKCTAVCKASNANAKATATSSCGSSAKVLKRSLGSMTCKCNNKDITSKVISKMFTAVTSSSSSAASATATNNAVAVALDSTSTSSSSTSSSTKASHTMVVVAGTGASSSGSSLVGGNNLIPLVDSSESSATTTADATTTATATSTGVVIAVNTQAVAVNDITLV